MACRHEAHEVESCWEETQFCKQNYGKRINVISKSSYKTFPIENSNITKKVIMSEVLLEDMQNVTIKGLAHECKSLSEEQSIPNVFLTESTRAL